jgi:hypothetical protein
MDVRKCGLATAQTLSTLSSMWVSNHWVEMAQEVEMEYFTRYLTSFSVNHVSTQGKEKVTALRMSLARDEECPLGWGLQIVTETLHPDVRFRIWALSICNKS